MNPSQLLLVKKSSIDTTVNDDLLRSSSIQYSYQHEENSLVHKVTPAPRSFSDIFAAPKMILVKKSNVQNKPLAPSSMDASKIVSVSSTTSSPKPSTTMQPSTSTTSSSTTTTTITTTTIASTTTTR